MRRVGAFLLVLLLITSCAKEEFVINTVRVEQSCVEGVNLVKFLFYLSLEDDYQAEIKDEYSLVWTTHLTNENGRYVSDELIIPYPVDGGKLDYKVISPSGRYLENSIALNSVEPCLWTIEDSLLMPKKAVNTKITLFSDTDSTVLISDEPILIEEGINKIKVEYDLNGVSYRHTLII